MSHSPLLLVFPYISLIRLLLRLTHFVVRLHLCFLGLQPVAVVLVLPWSSLRDAGPLQPQAGVVMFHKPLYSARVHPQYESLCEETVDTGPVTYFCLVMSDSEDMLCI